MVLNFMSDMQWTKLKEKMNYRKMLLDTRLQRKDAIFMWRISRQIGHKRILNNNSRDSVQSRISDLKTKVILVILLPLFASRHLMLPPLPNRAYTIKHLVIRFSWLIIMRSRNTEKFKKKKPLIKEILRDINNNRLVVSIWTILQAIQIWPKSFNSWLR